MPTKGRTTGKGPSRPAGEPAASDEASAGPTRATGRKGAGAGTKAKAKGKTSAGARRARPAGAERDDRPKRLLDLVVLLLGARGPVSYRELRSQFRAYQTENDEAGLRAFERDKAELLELGVPLRYVIPEEDDTVDEPGYVIDFRRYRMPEIHFTPEELGALVLAGSVARAAPGTTYAEVVDLAVKKLAFDLPAAPDTPRAAPRPAVPAEPVLVHFPRPSDPHLAERLADLEAATRNRKRVTMRYVGAAGGPAAARDVDPYGLVYRQGAWLLVGHCHLRGDVRSFRIDRMHDVQVAPKPKTPDFDRPPGFDVRRYADRSPWTFTSGEPAAVVLDVQPAASAVANEELGPDARREPLADGGVRVSFTCANVEYLVARVLAAKGALVVREPAAVRARVRAELEAILATGPDEAPRVAEGGGA